MKIKSGFVLRNVADSYVVVATGELSKEFNGMVKLNDTGAFLWEIAEKEIDREYMIQALLDNYQVTKEQAVKDVDKFIDIVTDNKFIEE